MNTAFPDNEELLNAWLRVSTAIRNDKIVPSLTYNESVVCHLLLRDRNDGGCGLTATDLCRETQIKKSQMNRILNALESRELIIRKVSEADRRRVLITMNRGKSSEFDAQHQTILKIVGGIAAELGPKRSREVVKALDDLADAARKVIME